jgi:regulatory protein
MGPRQPRAADAEQTEREPVAAAKEAALRLLAVRARSRAELERRLGQRGLPEAAVAAALERLEAVGLVDDPAFAEAYAESRAGRGRGAAAIRVELRGRGIDPEVADGAASAAVPADEQADRCRQVAAARLARLPGLDPEVQFRRLAGYLDRRGYPAALIETVVRELVDFGEGVRSDRL